MKLILPCYSFYIQRHNSNLKLTAVWNLHLEHRNPRNNFTLVQKHSLLCLPSLVKQCIIVHHRYHSNTTLVHYVRKEQFEVPWSQNIMTTTVFQHINMHDHHTNSIQQFEAKKIYQNQKEEQFEVPWSKNMHDHNSLMKFLGLTTQQAWPPHLVQYST